MSKKTIYPLLLLGTYILLLCSCLTYISLVALGERPFHRCFQTFTYISKRGKRLKELLYQTLFLSFQCKKH